MAGDYALAAHGTLISVSPDPDWPDGTTTTSVTVSFVEIAQLRDIKPPSFERNDIDCATQNSENEQYLVGKRRMGEMTFGINFNASSTTHNESSNGLCYSWIQGNRDIYKLVFPDTQQLVFSGFVTGIELDAPLDEAITADVTIRPTGALSWSTTF